MYQSTSVNREAVSKALKAIIGPLALAFACQGNWLMRRPVLVLVRDGRSRIDTEAMAAAAGIWGGEGGWGRGHFPPGAYGDDDVMEVDARPFDGRWCEMRQAVSSEVMKQRGLSEGDRILLPPSALHTLSTCRAASSPSLLVVARC